MSVLPKKPKNNAHIHEHVHHYVFETPAGEFSVGICKHCGNSKEARNWLPFTPINMRKWLEHKFVNE